jgi:RNA polymerase sigma factor (TIGR02999 family)
VTALPSQSEITQLLVAWGRGDVSAASPLLSLIYADLHRQAELAMRRENEGHTLQPTALVHEAYLRLVDQRVPWSGRAHFFGVAAQVMRRILVDKARERHAEKRGAGAHRVTLGALDAEGVTTVNDDSALVALHEALERLAQLDEKQARLVELRYFGGLTIDETAKTLGISRTTANREWATARAWLKRELRNQ